MHDTHPPAPMRFTGRILGLSALIFLCSQACAQKTPPMGWNSFSCYGASVTEQEVKANADMMAAHLREYGWQYIVVDFCWFCPHSGAMGTPAQNSEYNPSLTMDKFGRLLPALDKFPSAAHGKGFKPLADHVHGKGLKFGIHVMRGIPRQAYAWNTRMLGANQNSLNNRQRADLNKAKELGMEVEMGAKRELDKILDLMEIRYKQQAKIVTASRAYFSDI